MPSRPRSLLGSQVTATGPLLLVLAVGVGLLLYLVDLRPSAILDELVPDDYLYESRVRTIVATEVEHANPRCTQPFLDRPRPLPVQLKSIPRSFQLLERSGHMRIEVEDDGSSHATLPVFRASLTKKGSRDRVWDPDRGVCFGPPRLVDIVGWTEPNPLTGHVVVEYTWQYDELPDGFAEANPDLEGVGSPSHDRTAIHQTSRGWRVVTTYLLHRLGKPPV